MARPSKYDWNSIREAYEKGFSKDDIVRKFKIQKSILTNKINKEKWVVLCDVNSDIHELNAKSHQIAQNYTQNEKVSEMFIEKINTIIDDNELVSNNRKLLKAFQGIIGKGIREDKFSTPAEIKAGVSAIRDIESVASPIKSDIRVQNNIQNNQITEVKRTIVDSRNKNS